MNRSEEIGELAKALAAAQGEIKNAIKDQDNPFLKSKYADLASIVDACRQPLSKNGLAVIQGTNTTLNSEGQPISVVIQLETMLVHSSGQWISSIITMTPNKFDPQGIGATLTYARKYSLASICGVATEDTDAEAGGKGKNAEIDTKITYQQLEEQLLEVMKDDVWNEDQRIACNEFIASVPNFEALTGKLKQARWYVENKPKMDARERVKEEKLKKAKKAAPVPEQKELTDAENAALDAQLVP